MPSQLVWLYQGEGGDKNRVTKNELTMTGWDKNQVTKSELTLTGTEKN